MHVRRWWGIRHVRWLILAYRAQRWASMWAEMGVGLGYINESDERQLRAAWRGDA